ncbi:hypothetical protein FKP32DRAFT_1602153 [Trametes sanguinea]|nr:hypothetical protein FKP32DRAFT_1602153 [Trametes sanguinea]
MSPIQFKFTKPPDGLVRRVTFQERPSWNQLAAKIESLYDIPAQNVGVSYVDNDGDEVTLSSEEELQDFYRSATMQRPDGALNLVKVTVRDLDALRHDKPLPETPHSGPSLNFRNTFGRSAPVLFEMEVDDGWQRIPSGIAGLFAAPPVPPSGGSSPHAFVEVLESDAETSQTRDKDTQDNTRNTRTSTYTDSSLPEITESAMTDKGKGRAGPEDFNSDASSNQSVVAEETGSKHPIHVYNVKNRTEEDLTGMTRSRSRGSTALAPRTPTTPKSRTPAPDANRRTDHDDPPLPDLEDTSPPPTNIANDVANLFSTLSNILASHPELSEAEEAAGRRVADALGNVIRVIADLTAAPAADEHSHATNNEPATSTPIAERSGGRGEDSWAGGHWAHRGRGGLFGHHHHGGHGRHHSLHSHRGRHGSGMSWGTFGPPCEMKDSPTTPQKGPETPVRAPGEPSTSTSAAPPRRNTVHDDAQIISNARGPFPQLELYSVPRRSHTMHGTGHVRGPSGTTDASTNAASMARAIDTITKRLNDMGFTLTKYPGLPTQIESRVPRTGEMSHEREDNIIAEIVEDLVQNTPSPSPLRQTQPSGSGSRAT